MENKDYTVEILEIIRSNTSPIIRTLFFLFLFDNLNFKRNSRGELFLLKIHFFPFAGITRPGSMGMISACLPVSWASFRQAPPYIRGAKERKKRVMIKYFRMATPKEDLFSIFSSFRIIISIDQEDICYQIEC